jgi:hypothetical protein
MLGNPDEKTPRYEDKLTHSLFVMDEALNVDAIFTRYSVNYKNLLVIESLFHDIGRFEQMKVTGTFADIEIPKFYPGIKDHGDLGARVLKDDGLLEKLIPDVRLYDEEVQRVISNHSKITTNTLNRDILNYIRIFSTYDLQELFMSDKTEKERNALNRINTAIVQDVDRLDIFRKIVKGIWVPMTVDKSVDAEVWKLFKEGRLPSIEELKKQGKWNANVGHLVRMSFINQMNLVPVLIRIREENLIDRIYETTGNNGSYVQEAYEIAKEEIDKKIEDSEDGIIIRK